MHNNDHPATTAAAAAAASRHGDLLQKSTPQLISYVRLPVAGPFCTQLHSLFARRLLHQEYGACRHDKDPVLCTFPRER